ncbi:MAG TPA: dienelactone hydrolase family protein [Mycobacteriales bacterium]|nr:dienelactone hydrolase family protein [Mycobacteriales bacterium]
MCHDDDSRPPAPPRVGPVAESGDLVLTSADGTEFGAFAARPQTSGGIGVVLLPDVRGLHSYYRDLSVRFAEAGFDTVAIDYFGRTAGIGDRGDGFEWQPHREQTTPDGIKADAAAAVARLTAGGARAVFTVGFCFGGSHSWRLAASELPLAGTIGFYGKPALVADVLDQVHRPLLMLVAGADMTPQAEFAAMDAALTAAGREHETHIYAGAPHSFFDRTYADWQDACADAWQRILDFTARYAG